MKRRRVHECCKRDRENKCTSQKTSRNNQKADGREKAIQLPMGKCINHDLLAGAPLSIEQEEMKESRNQLKHPRGMEFSCYHSASLCPRRPKLSERSQDPWRATAIQTESMWPNGEHVLVTGGASGIGYEVAKQCLQQDARVTVLGRSRDKLELARVSLTSVSPHCATLQCDVQDAHQLHDAVSRCQTSSMGPVTAVMCSAGVSFPCGFSQQPASELAQAMRTNVEGSVNAARSAFCLGSLTRIMLVSSMAGQVGVTGFSAYSASKFALRGLAESLAMELKPNGVSVTLAFPPDTETPLLEAENARKPDETSAVSGSGGMAKARTVARSIIAAARVRRFQAPIGFEGWMLARLTAGFAPPDGALNLLSEVLLMGLLRAVAVSYLFVWSRMIAKHRQQTSTRAAEVKDQECSGEKK